jgi:hypothetical protein
MNALEQAKSALEKIEAAEPEWVDRAMTLAQEFASSWSLVGGRFDSGDQLEIAEDSKERLRTLLQSVAAPQQAAQPAPVGMTDERSAFDEFAAGTNLSDAEKIAHRITWSSALLSRSNAPQPEAAQPELTARHVTDAECAQGKCARPTTGCLGKCGLKPDPQPPCTNEYVAAGCELFTDDAAQPAPMLIEILQQAIEDEKRDWTGDHRKAAYCALDDVLVRFKGTLARLDALPLPAQQVAEQKDAKWIDSEHSMTLTAKQVMEALEFIAPDRDTDTDQLECEVTLINLTAEHAPLDDDNKRMPAGLYMYVTEYPEEGYVPLFDVDAAMTAGGQGK